MQLKKTKPDSNHLYGPMLVHRLKNKNYQNQVITYNLLVISRGKYVSQTKQLHNSHSIWSKLAISLNFDKSLTWLWLTTHLLRPFIRFKLSTNYKLTIYNAVIRLFKTQKALSFSVHLLSSNCTRFGTNFAN